MTNPGVLRSSLFSSVPAWIAVTAATAITGYLSARAFFGQPLGFMAGWSLFWGLLNKPQVVMTPNCDALDVNGVSEVTVKTNVGYALITIVTLGIYCPVNISWKCAKPCQQTDSL